MNKALREIGEFFIDCGRFGAVGVFAAEVWVWLIGGAP